MNFEAAELATLIIAYWAGRDSERRLSDRRALDQGGDLEYENDRRKLERRSEGDAIRS